MNEPRRIRRAARILLIDEHERLLLIRFAPPTRRAFWCGVGGECDPHEDFHEAAVRELFEETGLKVESCGPEVAQRTDDFITLEGELDAEARERLLQIAKACPVHKLLSNPIRIVSGLAKAGESTLEHVPAL